ncbi:CLUMA_CG012019, isoform A [Clunio marinus]|uniref:CLUMA_CG012019, isoform A n=1 Tax=Clunio marinus TaxID=568069 RepID=A0A1J1IKD2_9DIPT|nr:CLUMA_CG012019, isoform A [Clunio marinus]
MEFYQTKDRLQEIATIDFRILTAHYAKYQSFEENHRQKLAKTIIYSIFEADIDKILTKADFKYLAALVVELFPTETIGTYYVPSHKGSSPTGKLFSCYRNLRNTLAQVGLISRDTRNNLQPSTTIDAFPDSPGVGDESDNNILEGINTLRLDANKKFPHIENIDVKKSISSIAPKILDKVKLLRNETKAVSLLKEYLNDKKVDQSLLALILLPFIFSPAPFKRSWDDSASTSTAKHSKADAYRYFCSHFKTKEEMGTFDETSTVSSADPLPPRIYIIGCLKKAPTAVILLDDIEYEISDPLDAFDVMFKIFIGLNLKYPRQSVIVWTFIERFVYRLHQNHINNSQLLTIINEMTNYAGKTLNEDKNEVKPQNNDRQDNIGIHQKLLDDFEIIADQKYTIKTRKDLHIKEIYSNNQAEKKNYESSADVEKLGFDHEDPFYVKDEFEFVLNQRDQETQTDAFVVSDKRQEDSNQSKDDKLFCILYPDFVDLSKVQLGELLTEKIHKIEKLEDKNHKLEVAMKALL